MAYTLEQLAADCHAAIKADNGPGGREKVRACISRACADADFVKAHLGPDANDERRIIYQDPDFGFCILAHVYKGPKESNPHDHGPSWAIYGQAVGETMMTEWQVLEKPADGKPGKVKAARTYKMTPGDAYLYNIGDVHSPSRTAETRLIRVEGTDMSQVKRDKFDVAA